MSQKQPITALRLSKRTRGILERISDETGLSMTYVVEYLLDGAADRPERWPMRARRSPPSRGNERRAELGLPLKREVIARRVK